MQESKLFFFDTETTGTDPVENDIIHLHCIVDLFPSRKTIFETSYYMKPDFSKIDPKALEVNKFTIEEMTYFVSRESAHDLIVSDLSNIVDKYDEADKMYPVAWNGNFDYAFMHNWFKKCNDIYLGSFLNHRLLDPMVYLRFYTFINNIEIESFKLESIANLLDVSIEAHSAVSDTQALRAIFYKIIEDKLSFDNDVFSDDFEDFAEKMRGL